MARTAQTLPKQETTKNNKDFQKSTEFRTMPSIQQDSIASNDKKSNQSVSDDDSTNSDDENKVQTTKRKEKNKLKKNLNGAKKS